MKREDSIALFFKAQGIVERNSLLRLKRKKRCGLFLCGALYIKWENMVEVEKIIIIIFF